jgi:hypothetical protein
VRSSTVPTNSAPRVLRHTVPNQAVRTVQKRSYPTPPPDSRYFLDLKDSPREGRLTQINVKMGKCLSGTGVNARFAVSVLRATKLVAVVLAMFLCTSCSAPASSPEVSALTSSTPISAEYDLPASLYGCWEGSVDQFDSVTPLNWMGNYIKSVRTTYQMCYRRRPAGGGDLVLNKVELSGQEVKIVSFDNRVTAVDSGRRAGHLRNHAVFDQLGYLLWVFPVHAQHDIYAEEDIAMKNDNLIAMSGKQLIRVNGTDIAIVTFHSDFHRVPDTAQA